VYELRDKNHPSGPKGPSFCASIGTAEAVPFQNTEFLDKFLGKSVRQLLLVVVHTENERTIRIISARKAEPKERRQYEQS
jgi:uncharacterized DUF497 family protein